jgi:hypothetical protein
VVGFAVVRDVGGGSLDFGGSGCVGEGRSGAGSSSMSVSSACGDFVASRGACSGEDFLLCCGRRDDAARSSELSLIIS